MYQPLVPCPSCARHVLASETNCPFCSAALPTDLASHAIPAAGRRLGRAAAFVFGASLAVAGCSSDIEGGGDTSSSSTGGAGQDAGPDDDGGVMALYGDPPPDDGGGMALYGLPPPIDAGPPDLDAGPPPLDAGLDDGGGVPIYGAPPPKP